MVGDRQPRPVVLPAGEPAAPELVGTAIRADLDAIVGFAKESRTTKEIGSGQMWGRVTGFPSSTKTVSWAVEQFKKAGIADVRVQPIAQEANASFWMPLSWEVRLLADPAFGPGSRDVVLESAIPLSPSNLPIGTMTAPLVYVGTANPSVLQHIDVKGKIAVQLTVPQGHMLFERGVIASRSQDLLKRGAVGVFNLVRLPGNERSRDFSNCGNPCFNLGGRDGLFLESVLDRASQAGLGDKVRVQIALKTETRSGLKAENGIAVIPGRSDEVIILNAHVDGWFDGAGDNADGLAVLVAMARHFMKPEHQPERTLVFVASGGHHSPGLNGPSNFVRMNPALTSKTVLVLNLEHIAQFYIRSATWTVDSDEQPMNFGISNQSPALIDIGKRGVERYGFNLNPTFTGNVPGDLGGYEPLGVARVQAIHSGPMYHTSGDVAETISVPGLERAARFFSFFVTEASKTPRNAINPREN